MPQRTGVARFNTSESYDATTPGQDAFPDTHAQNAQPEVVRDKLAVRDGNLPVIQASMAPLQLFLMRALDEIDYGVILLDGRQRFWHANHLARVELNRGQILHLDNGHLATRVSGRQTALKIALERAGQGIRSMVDLQSSHGDLPGSSIAFVPMGHPSESYPDPTPVLAITCRQVLCAQISLHFFALSHGLTRTEEAILLALAQGMEVEDIVRERALAMSTVRSHVKQLRIKTRSRSMRELLNKVAVLPPVVSSIKSF